MRLLISECTTVRHPFWSAAACRRFALRRLAWGWAASRPGEKRKQASGGQSLRRALHMSPCLRMHVLRDRSLTVAALICAALIDTARFRE